MLELASVDYTQPGENDCETSVDIESFWKERLTAFSPVRHPPSDVYRSDDDPKGPQTHSQWPVANLLDPLQALCPDHEIEDILLSLASIYLYRTSGETDVSFGFGGQTEGKQGAGQSQDGPPITPFLIQLDAADTFKKVVQKVVAERQLGEGHGVSLANVFDRGSPKFKGAEAWRLPLPFSVIVGECKGDPGASAGAVVLLLDKDKRQATLQSNKPLPAEFGEATVGHLRGLVKAIAAHPQKEICLHEYLREEERRKILIDWNKTAVDYPYEGGLIGQFEKQVENDPQHPAVVFKGEELSYGEFNARVNRLASRLRKAEVGADTFIGICLDRSVEMVIAIWAILKAGGAYVPLNVEDPPQRLASIIRNAGVRIVLTEEKYAKKLPKTRTKTILLSPDADAFEKESSENPSIQIDRTDLAYMIYTSGSTGEPKGVLVEHTAIFNRIAWMQEEYKLTPEDRVLQKTPYTFDVSVWEFLWPMIAGATLVVAEPGGHVVPSYLARLMRQERITCVHFVPSVLRLFLSCAGIEDLPLRMVFCSGEALSYELQERFFSRLSASINNLYGPTEAAVDVTFWRCDNDLHPGRVPIGTPVANTKLHILDEMLQPVPVGVPGELYIGGICLARGYWQKPDLTEERFIVDPFSSEPESRLYKTGDVGRYLPDGSIEYLGRNDHQVKINGIRIELGEIESVIRSHVAVQDAVVVAKKNDFGNSQLAAYLVAKAQGKGSAALDHLREYLERRLTPHMVPRAFVFMNRMPLTVSGKVDRKALPEPETEM